MAVIVPGHSEKGLFVEHDGFERFVANGLILTGWTAVLPLIGVAVGAVPQHWLSRNAEARK